MSARPATGGSPYPHRTIAEVWEKQAASLIELDRLSRTRALTELESLRLERLLRTAA